MKDSGGQVSAGAENRNATILHENAAVLHDGGNDHDVRLYEAFC
jgi:hypothetical protein